MRVAVDRDKNAILLEALGTPLSDMGWSTERVMTTLVTTLRQAWTVALPTTYDIKTGAQKAQERHWLVDQLWDKLERPCPAEVVARAKRYCDRRAAAFAPAHAVHAHGDPHAGNALQVPEPRPGAESGFAFVDPDGLFIEPAYDLGAIMSGGEDELKGGASRALARQWCSMLAEASGADGQAIWEWAFIERVAIGLYALDHGWAWGQDKLDAAGQLS